MRRFALCLCWMMIACFAAAGFARAEDAVVRAALISQNQAFVVGAENKLALRLQIPDGWHIYGRTAPEIGLPTTVNLHLPAGLAASSIAWPAETEFVFQEIKGGGYTGDVLLPFTVFAKPDAVLGKNLRISAQVSWLVCKDVCIPETADLMLNLPVATSTKPSADAQYFEIMPKAAAGTNDHQTLLQSMLFAFLGGLILNLMPCVFPILSMKALGLIRKSHSDDRRYIVIGGWVYALGVLASFWILAAVMIALRAAGQEIGWGVQLQSPYFVGALAMVLLLIGLTLSDIIRVDTALANWGQSLTVMRGHRGTFFTGALAVLVATPCTAPFMGGAMFYALAQPWYITLIVFSALGLGLALPYLVLTLYPPALRYFPKPGPWMGTLKKFLAWPMYAAAVWLLWVLMQQVAVSGPTIHRNAEIFTPQRLEMALQNHQPVFVNMTASWCITCLVNERVALGTDAVTDFFQSKKIVYLVGDWTNRDPVITHYLEKYDRVGVPLYVFYDACGKATVLPQLLTTELVIQQLANHNQSCKEERENE